MLICIQDMSFPSGTILLSNSMPREQQGMAASVVNTVVNYSISLSLGIAGTIERNVNQGGNDVLKGYHGALALQLFSAGKRYFSRSTNILLPIKISVFVPAF